MKNTRLLICVNKTSVELQNTVHADMMQNLVDITTLFIAL